MHGGAPERLNHPMNASKAAAALNPVPAPSPAHQPDPFQPAVPTMPLSLIKALDVACRQFGALASTPEATARLGAAAGDLADIVLVLDEPPQLTEQERRLAARCAHARLNGLHLPPLCIHALLVLHSCHVLQSSMTGSPAPQPSGAACTTPGPPEHCLCRGQCCRSSPD